MSALGEMWGDRAVQALCGFVACKAETRDGIRRTMVGGVIFDSFGGEQWERWRGTVILIPKFIDVTRDPCAWEIGELMREGINRDVTEQKMTDPNSFWKPKWRSEPRT